MPRPQSFQIAQQEFDSFLRKAADALDLATLNQAYTVVEAVFRVRRRMMTESEILAYASSLPPILGALFIREWSPGEPALSPNSTADQLDVAVRSTRHEHNFAPPRAYQTVLMLADSTIYPFAKPSENSTASP